MPRSKKKKKSPSKSLSPSPKSPLPPPFAAFSPVKSPGSPSSSGILTDHKAAPCSLTGPAASASVATRSASAAIVAEPVDLPTDSKSASPSWSDLVKGPSGSMKKKGKPFLLDSGELCVEIPNSVISRNSKRWEPFILGQFHGNLPPKGALLAILNGIWSPRSRDITASKLGPKSILIKIPNPQTRKRVLNQGMWHIDGQTMFVADWEPGLSPRMPELTQALVWLEFRGVPPHFFSEEGLEHVAGALGEPKYLHPSTVNMTNLEVAKVFHYHRPIKASS